ncbi:MAG: hypothetical protein Q7T16_00260 [Candidatus Burarchaeum sp.]|nr:hypothetical protein [Candidatus Burarchaeum sp.]MDO8339071.1 hypothetical protein [Candidatus Burarchaeum sp.]
MAMPKMPNLKNGTTFIPKTLTIRSDQDDFLKKNSISLSRFVQQKIDEVMGASKARR